MGDNVKNAQNVMININGLNLVFHFFTLPTISLSSRQSIILAIYNYLNNFPISMVKLLKISIIYHLKS